MSTVDRQCPKVLELLVPATGQSDDITLLAAQRVSLPAPPRLWPAADLGAPAPARVAVARRLRRHDAGHEDVDALAHAIVELVTHAAEYSHPDRSTAPSPSPPNSVPTASRGSASPTTAAGATGPAPPAKGSAGTTASGSP